LSDQKKKTRVAGSNNNAWREWMEAVLTPEVRKRLIEQAHRDAEIFKKKISTAERNRRTAVIRAAMLKSHARRKQQRLLQGEQTK